MTDEKLVPLNVKVKCAVPDEGLKEHMLENIERENIPILMTTKPHDDVLVIVASGPSLIDNVELLRKLYTSEKKNKKILALKSSHDWLIERDIIPWGCLLLDAREHVTEMFTPHKDVTYFVASMCKPSTFDYLKDHKVVMWHAAVGLDETELLKGRPYTIIGGGSTSAMRASPVGYCMGFRTVLYFGLDSCFTDKKVHDYLQTKKRDGTERAIEVTVAGRKFTSTPEMIGQAQDFEKLVEESEGKMAIYVIGDGLIKWRLDHRYQVQLGEDNTIDESAVIGM